MIPELGVRLFFTRRRTADVSGRGSSRWGNFGGKTNIIIDENTKQTIKGILGSFTLIDLDQRWVKGFLESSGVIH